MPGCKHQPVGFKEKKKKKKRGVGGGRENLITENKNISFLVGIKTPEQT